MARHFPFRNKSFSSTVRCVLKGLGRVFIWIWTAFLTMTLLFSRLFGKSGTVQHCNRLQNRTSYRYILSRLYDRFVFFHLPKRTWFR